MLRPFTAALPSPNLGVGQFMRPGARPFTADQVQAENTAQTYAAKLYGSHPAGSFGAKAAGPVAGGAQLHAAINKTLGAFTAGNAGTLGAFRNGVAQALQQFRAGGISAGYTGTAGYAGYRVPASLHASIAGITGNFHAATTKTLNAFTTGNAKVLGGFQASNAKTLKGFTTGNAKVLGAFTRGIDQALAQFKAGGTSESFTGTESYQGFKASKDFNQSVTSTVEGFRKDNAETVQSFEKENADDRTRLHEGVGEAVQQLRAGGTSTSNTGTAGYTGFTARNGQSVITRNTSTGTVTSARKSVPLPPGFGFVSPKMRAQQHVFNSAMKLPLAV